MFFMLSRIGMLVVLCYLFTGCYKAGPGEDETQTVPVTNNPHLMPGDMPSSPLFNTF